MPSIDGAKTNNRLLQRINEADLALLAPFLEPVPMRLNQLMIDANAPITHLYFPETGFISVTTSQDGTGVEIGLIGREGVAGASPVLLGSDRTPFQHFVQAPGTALAIPTTALNQAVAQSSSLREFLLRYVQIFLIQTSQTAYVNAVYNIEARLARWLLMCQDRLGTDELLLTHEFLSIMLGVQRTSVTLALQMLEGAQLIRSRRGRVEVRDRAGLIATADQGYGLPEAEYARLIERA